MVLKRFNIVLAILAAALLCFVFSATPSFAGQSSSELTPAKKAEMEKEYGMDEGDNLQGDPYETGRGVHADPETFKKDFHLTFDQKEYTIKEMQRVINEIIGPNMSDLEKYYVLARWVNKHVNYDWQFWNGRYYFEYYSHQWDSYGGMKEDEKSVCAGIAIFYANMCHAAGLPCKFVRLDPSYLDHTITYIPDINGHSYFADITEDVFLMSENSCNAPDELDKGFANITDRSLDETFDYHTTDDITLTSSAIKEYYDTPFDVWFNEYALHKNTKKIFGTKYVEKGSGVRGQHYADYGDYESNRTKTPGLWFLDDFYENPQEVATKVTTHQFDAEVCEVAGIKKGYDSDSEITLMNQIRNDIQVKCFPSVKNGEIVPETTVLERGKDYDVFLGLYDREAKKAKLIVRGIGDYSGEQVVEVKINSVVIDKTPVRKLGLSYTGVPQALITAGEAISGEMQYALGTETEPTSAFTTDIPRATNAGVYYVWYKAVGDAVHGEIGPEKISDGIVISKAKVDILHDDITIRVGETVKLNPVLDNGMDADFKYYALEDEKNVKVDKEGNVTGLNAGFTSIIVDADLKEYSDNYKCYDWLYVGIEIEPVSIANQKVTLSKTAFTYNGKAQKPIVNLVGGKKLAQGKDYTVKITPSKSVNAGTYTVRLEGNGNYEGVAKATYKINKASNPIKLKAKTVKIKHKKLKKTSKSVKRANAFTVSKAKGTLSYKLVSAKKKGKNFKTKFKVDTKTGKITVKKGTKKGTYSVKVKVKAKGTSNFKASAWKNVTFKVKVQ